MRLGVDFGYLGALQGPGHLKNSGSPTIQGHVLFCIFFCIFVRYIFFIFCIFLVIIEPAEPEPPPADVIREACRDLRASVCTIRAQNG